MTRSFYFYCLHVIFCLVVIFIVTGYHQTKVIFKKFRERSVVSSNLFARFNNSYQLIIQVYNHIMQFLKHFYSFKTK